MSNSAIPNDFHKQLLQQLPGLIVVMDCNSKFMYSNDYTAKMFGYKNEESMIGIDAYGMRCPAADSAEDFIKQDQLVLKLNNQVNMLDIHGYADQAVKILITKKSPFKVDDKTIGVICHCVEVNNLFLRDICAAVMKTDSKYFDKNQKNNRSYIINSPGNHSKLTDREMDCLFYLLRGCTGKQIAKQLNLSPRTVETHINNIKLRLGCENKSDIIEYALLNGYLNYIPEKIIAENISQVIQG